MSERFKVQENTNDSKATRLPIRREFAAGRFNRDAMAHVSRYLWVMERIEALAVAHGPLRILDVGCGDAYVARCLHHTSRRPGREMVAEYVGVDVDARRIEETTKEIGIGAFPVRFSCEDLTTGMLAGHEPYDVLVCMEVLEHVQPHFVGPILKRFGELAKRRAFISTPHWPGGSGQLPKDHIKEWDHFTELLPLMTEAGLHPINSIGTFCQLDRVKQMADRGTILPIEDEDGVPHPIPLAPIYDLMRRTFDKNFASLVLARFIGGEAQNLLHECEIVSAASPEDYDA